MRLFAIAVLVLSLAGCANSSSSDSTSAPLSADVFVRELTATADASPSSTARKIVKYLSANFQDTSWHPSIKNVSISAAGHVEIGTDLSDPAAAVNVCGAVSGYIFGNPPIESPPTIIRIYGDDSQLLVLRTGQADQCNPQ